MGLIATEPPARSALLIAFSGLVLLLLCEFRAASCVARGRADAKPPALTYKAPPGWKDTGPRVVEKGGIRVAFVATFSPAGGGKDDEVTVTALNLGANKLAQVNRWRAQLGL